MAYINDAILVGNLGKSPEIRVTNSGKKCARFSLATSKRYRDANGEQKELTYWHNCIVWGKLADTLESINLAGGTCVLVRGEITYSSYEKDGNRVTRTEINVANLQILSPKSSTAHASGNAKPQAQQQQSPTEEEDDDLPF